MTEKPFAGTTVFLQRWPDGTFVDWGRHATVRGVRGQGPARWYKGEAAEVMALVLKHATPPRPRAPSASPATLRRP